MDFKDPEPPASPEQLAAAERKLAGRGFPMPASYRQLLSVCDGGRPLQAYVPFPDDGEEGHVQVFLGIGGPVTDSACTVQMLTSGVPRGVFPIASDDLGNQYCIDMRDGGDDGPVVFIDLDEMPEDVPDDQPLRYVAPSLAAFQDMLIYRPPPELPPRRTGLRRLFSS